ncbi:MAG TPA: EndoU domain-containing protein [Bacillota bacterium]|nr:EndoU domain-containing protein [Bacillota bacterium]
MKYIFNKISVPLIILLLLGACSGIYDEPGDSSNNEISEVQDITLNDLSDTDHFREGTLEHIFIGEINRHGDAVGFHYDGFPGKKGHIIPGTKTDADEQGVYEAKVKVDGIEKVSNGGKSSFFPVKLNPQDVVDVINEAYENHTHINGNTYEGLSDSGIVVHMYLDESEHIISAFPLYGE